MERTSWVLLTLFGLFVGACQPDLQRECTSANDCPTGYRCVYSSCELLDAGEANNTSQPDADDDAAQEEDTAQDPAPDTNGGPDADASEGVDMGEDADTGKDTDRDEDADHDDAQDANEDPSPDGDEDVDVGPRCDEGEMECGQGCVDVLSDAEHCGGCEACPSVEGALAACEQGSCVYECSQGRVDANGDLTLLGSDGCECELSGVEVCDDVDNDCNGVADDTPGLSQICPEIPFSLPVCAEGGCSYTCLPQRVDVNGDLGQPDSDGCECLVTGPEICDNQDNNCNGEIDEENDFLCDLKTGSTYECQEGLCMYECIDDRFDANQDLQSALGDGCECVISGEEVCDNIDNDCNGQVDEENANLCETKENAVYLCNQGQCNYSCEDSYYDANQNLLQDLGDGCECRFQGAEVCDLMDNDCDGLVDEEENSILCETLYRASFSCEEGSCVYSCEENYYVDLNRDLRSMPSDGCECDSRTPEQCDGVDNDCDGSTDTQDPSYVPSACEYTMGACAGAERRCEQGAPVPCSLEDYRANNPMVTGLPTSLELLCDGEDNNCDGVEDELCCTYQEARRLVSGPLHPSNQQLAPSLAMDPEERYSMFVWQEHTSIGVGELPKQGSVRLAMIDNRTGATAYAIHYPSEDPIQNYHPTVTWDGEAFVNVWVRRLNASQSYLAWQKKELDNNNYLTNTINTRLDVDLSNPHVVGLGGGSSFLSWSQGTLSPNPNACPNTQATRCIQYALLDESGNTLETHEVATGSGRKAIFPRYMPDGSGGGLLTWIEPSVSRSRLAWMYLRDSRTPGTVSYYEIENNNQDIRPSIVKIQDKYYIIYSSYGGNWGISMIEISSSGTLNSNSIFLVSSQYILRDFFATSQNNQVYLYWISTGLSSLILSRSSFNTQGQTQIFGDVLSNLYNSSFGSVFALPSPSYGEVFVAATNSTSNQPLGLTFSYINLRGNALCP